MRLDYDNNFICLMNHRKFLPMLKHLLDNISDFVATRSFDFVAFIMIAFVFVAFRFDTVLNIIC